MLLKGKEEAYQWKAKQICRTEIQMARVAWRAGNFCVVVEPRLAFVIRIRDTNCVSPKVQEVLQLLCLRWVFSGTFVKLNKASVNMLRIAEPYIASVQFSCVAQLCPTLCDPMDRSSQASLSITNSQSLLKFTSIESVMPSNHLVLCLPFSSCPQSFPASGSFPMGQLFTSGGQSIGVSASTSVLQWIFRTDLL